MISRNRWRPSSQRSWRNTLPSSALPLESGAAIDAYVGSVGDNSRSSLPWIALDKWGTRLLSIAVLLVLGRVLAVEDFGLVALAQVFIAFASVFVDQGFSKALIQRANLDRVHIDTAFWTSVGLSVALGAGTVALSTPIAALFGNEALQPVIAALSAGLVMNALASTPSALLERNFQFRPLAIRRVAGAFVGGVAAVAMALAGFGVWALVAQTLIAALVGLVTIWITARWMPRAAFSGRAFKELWAVGAGILGIELVGLVNSQADRVLVGAFFSAEALGLYFMAMRLVSLLVELFSSVFSTLSLTSLSRLQGDRPAMLAWLYRLAGASCGIAVPVFATAGLLAPAVIPLVLGAQWQPSIVLFQILCGLGALNAIAYFDRSTLIAVGRSGAAFSLTLGQSVLGILLVLAAAPFGLTAVAAAVTGRQYIYWPIRLWYLKKYAGVAPWTYFSRWLGPFLMSMGVLAVGAAIVAVFPGLVGSPLTYVVVLGAWSAVAFYLATRFLTPRTYTDVMSVLRRRK